MAIAKTQTKVVIFQPRKEGRLSGWLEEGERRGVRRGVGWSGVGWRGGKGGGTYLGGEIRSVITYRGGKRSRVMRKMTRKCKFYTKFGNASPS
jgi:hypothetical protein